MSLNIWNLNNTLLSVIKLIKNEHTTYKNMWYIFKAALKSRCVVLMHISEKKNTFKLISDLSNLSLSWNKQFKINPKKQKIRDNKDRIRINGTGHGM